MLRNEDQEGEEAILGFSKKKPAVIDGEEISALGLPCPTMKKKEKIGPKSKGGVWFERERVCSSPKRERKGGVERSQGVALSGARIVRQSKPPDGSTSGRKRGKNRTTSLEIKDVRREGGTTCEPSLNSYAQFRQGDRKSI